MRRTPSGSWTTDLLFMGDRKGDMCAGLLDVWRTKMIVQDIEFGQEFFIDVLPEVRYRRIDKQLDKTECAVAIRLTDWTIVTFLFSDNVCCIDAP